jgi:hypothetical protein
MKRLIALAVLAGLATGCAVLRYEKTAADGTHTKARAFSLFSNSALKNLAVGKVTKTTTNEFTVTGTTTEPNPEAITASAEAIGTIVGVAAKSAAK